MEEQLTKSSLIDSLFCQAQSTEEIFSYISVLLKTQYLRNKLTEQKVVKLPFFVIHDYVSDLLGGL